MTRVEELQARADKIKKTIDWIDPQGGHQNYVGGLMPVKITLGHVLLGIELRQIRREIAGVPPIEVHPEQKGEVT